MENKHASMILGNPYTPYLNSLVSQGRYFTNYKEGDPTGPSLPDYLEIAAGSRCGKDSDKVSAGEADIGAACPTTLWNQLQDAGISWAVYEDAMPQPCYAKANYQNFALDTPYALKHNPATPFPSIFGDQTLCRAHVLPFSSIDPANLPAVSFIAPGICNDQHGTKAVWPDGTPKFANCYPKTPELYKRGDDWLAANLPPLLSAGAEVIVTYDESGTLYAVEVGPNVPAGSTDATPYTHYSILAAIEDAYGLPRLGDAASATPIPL
jgi:acid phosphatase